MDERSERVDGFGVKEKKEEVEFFFVEGNDGVYRCSWT